jgi:Na+/phosphate symporter
LVIFLPIVDPFARWLTTLFPETETYEAQYLTDVSQGVSKAAVDAVERETAVLIRRAERLLMTAFDPPLPAPSGIPPVAHKKGLEAQRDLTFDERYHAAKKLEGELVEFTIRLQTNTLEAQDSERLTQMLGAARSAMHSAKAIKNIRHNLLEMAGPASNLPEHFLTGFRSAMQEFLGSLYQLRDSVNDTVTFEDLADALRLVQKQHDKLHDSIYAGIREEAVDEGQISSLLNVTREVLNSSESLLFALSDYYLSKEQAENLERIPQ